jgi:DNA-binding transcriptional LysR family regulator
VSREHKKLERLMLFAEVARLLSFSKAAENLSISRGYLSDQIKRLEQELSTPLLIRSTRKIRLTDNGEQVYAEAEKISRSLTDMERHINQDRDSLSGLLRITAPKLFAKRFLLKLCRDFQKKYPNILFDIDCSNRRNDLITSKFDLAFRATNTPPNNMIAKHLLNYSRICCAAPEYLNRMGHPKTPSSLQHHQCLSSSNDHMWHFNSGSVETTGWLTVNDNEMLKQQALNGNGIIKICEYDVDEDIAQGKLEHVLSHESLTSNSIYLIHPKTVVQNIRLRSFISYVQRSIDYKRCSSY